MGHDSPDRRPRLARCARGTGRHRSASMSATRAADLATADPAIADRMGLAHARRHRNRASRSHLCRSHPTHFPPRRPASHRPPSQGRPASAGCNPLGEPTPPLHRTPIQPKHSTAKLGSPLARSPRLAPPTRLPQSLGPSGPDVVHQAGAQHIQPPTDAIPGQPRSARRRSVRAGQPRPLDAVPPIGVRTAAGKLSTCRGLPRRPSRAVRLLPRGKDARESGSPRRPFLPPLRDQRRRVRFTAVDRRAV